MRRLVDRIWLVVGLLALGACSTNADVARKGGGVPVRVGTALRMDAPITLTASGMVEPMQTVAVTAQVSGTLLDAAFHEGDYVIQGQVLFQIDQRPMQTLLDQARAALGRDQAQLAAAQKDDDRYQSLAAKGYVTGSQADQVHASAQAQASTVAADQAAVRAAEINLGYATIRAPIAGRTGGLLVRRGNVVSPGSGPLVIINQIRPVLVRFPIPEDRFAAVSRAVASHPLTVSAASKDTLEVAEQGKLTFIDNAIDSLTGTVTGKADFPNAASRLWPGELVFLTVQLDVLKGVLAVPTVAVMAGPDSSFVYVVNAQNMTQQRTVVPGIEVGSMTLIQRGLEEGERVIVDGQSRVSPGARVTILGPAGDTAQSRRLGATGALGDSIAAGPRQ